MNTDEANSLKKNAINILKQSGSCQALQWLIDQRLPKSFITLDVESPEGERNEKKIDRSICFTTEDNRYELFYVGGHSGIVPLAVDLRERRLLL
jgi:hypothetical protein